MVFDTFTPTYCTCWNEARRMCEYRTDCMILNLTVGTYIVWGMTAHFNLALLHARSATISRAAPCYRYSTTANETTVTHQIGLVVPKASNQDTWYNHISKRIHSILTLFLLRGSPEVGGAFVDSGGVPQFSLPTSDTMKSTEIMAWLHQNRLCDGNCFV